MLPKLSSKSSSASSMGLASEPEKFKQPDGFFESLRVKQKTLDTYTSATYTRPQHVHLHDRYGSTTQTQTDKEQTTPSSSFCRPLPHRCSRCPLLHIFTSKTLDDTYADTQRIDEYTSTTHMHISPASSSQHIHIYNTYAATQRIESAPETSSSSSAALAAPVFFLSLLFSFPFFMFLPSPRLRLRHGT